LSKKLFLISLFGEILAVIQKGCIIIEHIIQVLYLAECAINGPFPVVKWQGTMGTWEKL
jgi:hypothetical protein